MIYLKKSKPAPSCLAVEKLKKKSKNWRCGDVVSRLKEDFKNKCYICEEKEISSINVEHFVPHRNTNRNLMFDWNNLFYVCGHCNNSKLAKIQFDNILNCTQTRDVETKIKYEFFNCAFPKEQVIITSLDVSSAENLNTVELLQLVYCGDTAIKIEESANIRNKISKKIWEFIELLSNYFSNDGLFSVEEKANLKCRIIIKLSRCSSFTAFKQWIIRENPTYFQEFQNYLN
jgi:hypothetical protein